MIPPNRVYCPACTETVFHSNVPMILRNITFERLYTGERRWYSRTFHMVIHQCGVDLSEQMEITVSDVGEKPDTPPCSA